MPLVRVSGHHGRQGVDAPRRRTSTTPTPPAGAKLKRRASLGGSELDALIERKISAGLALQCGFRVMMARRRIKGFRQKRAEKDHAALMIQRNMRMMQAMRDVETKRIIAHDEKRQAQEKTRFEEGLQNHEKLELKKADIYEELEKQDEADGEEAQREEVEREILRRLATDEYVEVQEAVHKKNFTRELERELVHLMTNLTDKDADPELIEDLSARVLQAGLMGLMARKSTILGIQKKEMDDAVALLQGAMRGGAARRHTTRLTKISARQAQLDKLAKSKASRHTNVLRNPVGPNSPRSPHKKTSNISLTPEPSPPPTPPPETTHYAMQHKSIHNTDPIPEPVPESNDDGGGQEEAATRIQAMHRGKIGRAKARKTAAAALAAGREAVEQLDDNNDGVIDEAEFADAGGTEVEFKLLDRNQDGVLDADEMAPEPDNFAPSELEDMLSNLEDQLNTVKEEPARPVQHHPFTPPRKGGRGPAPREHAQLQFLVPPKAPVEQQDDVLWLKNENAMLRRQLEVASRHAWNELQSKWDMERKATDVWNTCAELAAAELYPRDFSHLRSSDGSRLLEGKIPAYEIVMKKLLDEQRARENLEHALEASQREAVQARQDAMNAELDLRDRIEYLEHMLRHAGQEIRSHNISEALDSAYKTTLNEESKVRKTSEQALQVKTAQLIKAEQDFSQQKQQMHQKISYLENMLGHARKEISSWGDCMVMMPPDRAAEIQQMRSPR